ncbi:uL30 family ribosomal protein [Sinomonas sp. P47F7]|uniref:uL30 family ribosomal protein n=1 Tax=Sinomonas sp. P47F7 TaxID=3410987 RepID=UPI003BF56E83
MHSYGGIYLFILTHSLIGATKAQQQCAKDLKLNKIGRGCILGIDRPELLGKLVKIRHLVSLYVLQWDIPAGNFRITIRGDEMMLRHEKFDVEGIHGEAVIAGSNEYLRVENSGEGTGAVWTSDLDPAESIRACLEVMDAHPNDEDGYLVFLDQEDGSDVEFEGRGPSTEIFDYVQEHPDRVLYVVLSTDRVKLTWEAPDTRILSAQHPTAEAGIYQDGLTRASMTRLLGRTATVELRAHSRAVSRRIKQLPEAEKVWSDVLSPWRRHA